MKILSVRFVIVLCSALWLPAKGYGQLDSVARCLEKIKVCGEDSLRLVYAGTVGKLLEQTAYGSYEGKQAVKYLNYKKCRNADGEMYCWVVPLQQGQAFYHLFRFKDKNSLYRLDFIPGSTQEGMPWLFYDWLAFHREGEIYFVLLGWNKKGNVNRKTIRIARFEEEGKIRFGYSFIHHPNGQKLSFLDFEYAVDGSMLLKPDRNGERIIFDHLAPNDSKYEGYYMFYGADGSTETLELREGEWELRTKS